MSDLPEELLYEGVSVDFRFHPSWPNFGDLLLLCGASHPAFPPSGAFPFDRLAELEFTQVDDYFGVRALSEEGDDVPIWLYPLLDGEPMHHHPGPFAALRLSYNVLRNPVRRANHFLRCVEAFAATAAGAVYRERQVELGIPPDLQLVRADIDGVVKHWAERGIVVGSPAALEIDF